jgi:hypothetical protein
MFVEKSETSEGSDETLEVFWIETRLKSRFGELADYFKRGEPVEVLGDEMLNFAEPKKSPCFRVLYDTSPVVSGVVTESRLGLGFEDQVFANLRFQGTIIHYRHRLFKSP